MVATALASFRGPKDVVLVWDNCLEDVLLSPGKVDPQWVLAQYGGKAWTAIQADPALSKYCGAIEAIKSAVTSS